MSERESEQERRREYEGDVIYDVWRAGGNPDAVDLDAVGEHYYYGDEAEATVRDELSEQRRPR